MSSLYKKVLQDYEKHPEFKKTSGKVFMMGKLQKYTSNIKINNHAMILQKNLDNESEVSPVEARLMYLECQPKKLKNVNGYPKSKGRSERKVTFNRDIIFEKKSKPQKIQSLEIKRNFFNFRIISDFSTQKNNEESMSDENYKTRWGDVGSF